MNRADDYDILKKYIETLKEISLDTDNKEYMTQSSIQAVNFDKVKTKYTNNLGLSEEAATSFDSLAFIDHLNTFIEFKNGKMSNRDRRNVHDKIRDSTLILCDIFNETISYTREHISLIVVYNEDKKPLTDTERRDWLKNGINSHLAKKANIELIRFGFHKYQKFLFKEVHTYSRLEFEEYLKTIV